MKNSRLRTVAGSMLAVLALAGAVNTQAVIGEVFVCDWADGPDMDGLMGARDYYLEQAQQAGVPTPPAYVWTPVKVGPGAPELLWFNYYQTAEQYGQVTEAFAASAEMAQVTARFEGVINCRSGLFNQELIHDGGSADSLTPPAYIQSSACNFRSGAPDPEALADLTGHIAGVLGESGSYSDYLLFQRISITRSMDTPHVRFFSVHDDAAAWGARNDGFPSMEGAAALGRHFQSTLNCSQSHWLSQQVVEGPSD